MNLSVAQGCWLQLGMIELLRVDKYMGAGRCPLSVGTLCVRSACQCRSLPGWGMWFLVPEKGYGILDGIWKFLFQSDFSLSWAI